MPTNRVPLHRRRGLSFDQLSSLHFGDDLSGCPAFASDDERRAAWLRHRDPLMTRLRWGIRPDGWWCYECPIAPQPTYEYRAAALFEAGLLTEQEREQLLGRWRREFDRAQEPDDFSHCIGLAKPGDTFASWLEGDAARQRHYEWAGIPKSLLRRWTAARQRRMQRLKKEARPQKRMA
jgi:hypothetical protein